MNKENLIKLTNLWNNGVTNRVIYQSSYHQSMWQCCIPMGPFCHSLMLVMIPTFYQ